MLKFLYKRFQFELSRFIKSCKTIGCFAAIQYELVRIVFKFFRKSGYFKIFIKGHKFPIYGRFNTSDLNVFGQIFIEQQYSCKLDLKEPNNIVDCGAYVGYSSLFFLIKYPHSQVVAVEPDGRSFIVAQKNLAPYSQRVSLIASAIWPYEAELIMSKGNDGREWSMQVRQCRKEDAAQIKSITMQKILEKLGTDAIDLLKIDIEGSECEVFKEGYTQWLDKTRNIIIELHGEENEEIFLKAMSSHTCNITKSGELTICGQISLKTNR